MIPQTYPSNFNSAGRARMIIYMLPSVTGLTRWIDYIPVKSPTNETNLEVANSFANDGFILTSSLSDINGLVPFRDYVPVYLDLNATVAWSADNNGYIPMEGLASFFLNFADGSNVLDPRVTFSRSSNATVTDSDGNIVLAPHNLLTFSEQFDNAAWSKTSGTVTANAGVAPDGTTTADQIASTGAGVFRSSITVTQGLLHTASVYAKNVSGGGNFIFGFDSGPASGRTTFNLQNGTVVSNEANVVSSSITAVGNGWYRCVVSAVTTSTSCILVYYNATSGANWLVWGAQLNQGSLQPYYPTTVKNLLGFSEAFENAAWTKSNSFIQTNLLTFSEQFDNAAWVLGTGTISANSAASPLGTNTADTYTTTGTSTQSIYQSSNVAASTVYTFSVYVKLGTMSASDYKIAIYNNTAASFIATDVVPSQTPMSTEWTRITYSFTTPVGCTSVRVYPFRNSASISSSTLILWGAQLVQGASAGDYVQTTSAALPVMYQAPNGTMTADKLVEDTANAQHHVRQAYTTTNQLLTLSVYAKAAERNRIFLQLSNNATGAAGVQFDLVNGVAGTPATGGDFTNASASIVPIGNGWFRCSLTALKGSANTAAWPYLSIADSSGNVSYTGNGTSGIYIWGAQLSDSASLDPYVNNPVAAPSSTAYYGARFDYDPVTRQPRGLLIEEARTNLLLRSEEFDNASWTASGVTVSANTAISPDGTQDADKVIPTAVLGTYKELQQNFNATLGVTYTYSQYVKADGYNFVQLIGVGSVFGSFYVNFNLTTGQETAFSAGNSTVVARGIQSIGNGWYRISVSVTALSTSNGARLAVNIIPSATSARGDSWTGDGTSGVLYWGAQLEAGAFPTSYIPTTTATVTRAADVAVIQGSNFSSWYKYDEGTLFTEVSMSAISSAQQFFAQIGTVSTDYLNVFKDTTGSVITSRARVGGVDQAYLSSVGASTANTIYKTAFAYQVNNFASSTNGATASTDTSGTIPVTSVTAMGIGGSFYTSSVQLNGWIRRINYYNRRLDNSQLQEITR